MTAYQFCSEHLLEILAIVRPKYLYIDRDMVDLLTTSELTAKKVTFKWRNLAGAFARSLKDAGVDEVSFEVNAKTVPQLIMHFLDSELRPHTPTPGQWNHENQYLAIVANQKWQSRML